MSEGWWSSWDCVGNTYFKLSTRIYTRDQEVEIKSMIDLELVKKDMLRYVRGVRGMGRDLSSHHVVLSKVRLVGAWIKRLGLGGLEVRN